MKLSKSSFAQVRIFGVSAAVTVLSLAGVLVWLGPAALLATAILIGVELAFSFDNAIINAKVLGRMSPFWQQMFLTIGVVLAIFGMRVVFPMLIVMLTAHLPLGSVFDLAFNHPRQYADKLTLAHPAISAFGGSFLLMLALHFFMDDQKKVHWIAAIERPLKAAARWWLPAFVSLIVLVICGWLAPLHERQEVLRAGLSGIALFLAINVFTEWIGSVAGRKSSESHTGTIALLMFVYLQILDASFSFDSVIGAFAITNDVILIAVGLGVGAIWVRSLTVYMVRHEVLNAYKYLEHGAHYAVAALSLAMLVSILVDVPQLVTGTVGIALIGASLAASLKIKRA